jgi:3'(2'), 5'-bisphosphate nucleotidase
LCPVSTCITGNGTGAGAHASRIDGAPLAYNQKDPRLPDIVVCHPVSAPTLLTGIRDVTPPG